MYTAMSGNSFLHALIPTLFHDAGFSKHCLLELPSHPKCDTYQRSLPQTESTE